VLFVTTTNFMEAVDEAFLSRADLVMRFALPDVETIAKILESALGELAVQWPALLPLTKDSEKIMELAKLCEGWDGRRIRKLILAALSQRLDVARDPAKLAWDDLFAAARKKGGVEWAGAPALSAREMFPDVPKSLMHDHDHDHGHGPHKHTHTHQKDDDDNSRS
jgi:AAA+ superfamily predicted ATPase